MAYLSQLLLSAVLYSDARHYCVVVNWYCVRNDLMIELEQMHHFVMGLITNFACWQPMQNMIGYCSAKIIFISLALNKCETNANLSQSPLDY